MLFCSLLPNFETALLSFKVPRLCPLHLPTNGVLRWKQTRIIGLIKVIFKYPLHPSIKGYQLLLYKKTDQDTGYKNDHPVVSHGA